MENYDREQSSSQNGNFQSEKCQKNQDLGFVALVQKYSLKHLWLSCLFFIERLSQIFTHTLSIWIFIVLNHMFFVNFEMQCNVIKWFRQLLHSQFDLHQFQNIWCMFIVKQNRFCLLWLSDACVLFPHSLVRLPNTDLLTFQQRASPPNTFFALLYVHDSIYWFWWK